MARLIPTTLSGKILIVLCLVLSGCTDERYDEISHAPLADYAKTYGDSSYILAHDTQIRDIVNVMFATMGENGYTYAKPDYKICYLMDNAEVYAGLCAADG